MVIDDSENYLIGSVFMPFGVCRALCLCCAVYVLCVCACVLCCAVACAVLCCVVFCVCVCLVPVFLFCGVDLAGSKVNSTT